METMNTGKSESAVVGHVGIEVTNLVKSKEFYRTMLEGLGFHVAMDSESGVGFSNQIFQVWLARPQKPRIRRKSPVGEEFIVADHLAILVNDNQTVDTVDKAMKQHGFEPLFPCEEIQNFVQVTMQYLSLTRTTMLWKSTRDRNCRILRAVRCRRLIRETGTKVRILGN